LPNVLKDTNRFNRAETIAVATHIIFWGCAGMNYRVLLPFHGMRQDFASF
jgi:hypothetical protein